VVETACICYIDSTKGGRDMMYLSFVSVTIGLVFFAAFVYLFYLVVKALKKYNGSQQVRKEKAEKSKTLGEVLKNHRIECKMTQEFVAESIGVSRQAVSKWESGKSDPSTTNLLALADLFGISAEDLLKEVK